MIGTTVGAYRVVDKLGEGGPPPLARFESELRRDRAVALEART